MSTPTVRVDGQRSRQGIVKLPPSSDGSLFAARLDSPRGLAFDSHGHLYVADGGSERVIRFLAPLAPTLTGVPRFTNRTPLPVSGTTVPNARLDVFVDALSVPIASLASPSGAFTTSIPLSVNAETDLDVFATAARSGRAHFGGGRGERDPRLRGASTRPPAAARRQLCPRHGPDSGSGERRPSLIASVALSAAGQALGTSVAPPLPSASATATAAWSTTTVADGTHTLSVVAVDRTGNTTTLNRPVIVDNTPPTTEITSGPPATITQPTAVFAFAGTDNLTPASSLQFAWSLDGGPPSGYGTVAAATVGPLPPGRHVFEVRARDLAGNEDPSPARREFVAPTGGITISEPTEGAVVAVGSTLVRGRVDAGAPDVGVSVNGFAALDRGQSGL